MMVISVGSAPTYKIQATIAEGSGDEVRGKHLVLVQDVPSAALAQCTGISR